MSKMHMKLSEHPRLYIGAQELKRLHSPKEKEFHSSVLKLLIAEGRRHVKNPEVVYAKNCHNEHLLRARAMQKKVVTLITCWMLENRDAFRSAAIDSIKEMAEWQNWSWIAWRKGDNEPASIFDLSYGENSATLAIAYDLLYPTLSAGERKLFVDTARKWSFAAGLKNLRNGTAWWFGAPHSNWNSVCAGGLGMLAMAMFEDLDESVEALEFTEKSMIPFIKTLNETNGGWPEGTGYWNYGMRYAFMYLLSHERAFRKPHPLMKLKGIKQTLRFPMDFCPNGEPCGFGDANGWLPLPFHFAAAERLNRHDIIPSLQKIMERSAHPTMNHGQWPNLAEYLMLCPEKCRNDGTAKTGAMIRLYRGLDWGVVTDSQETPSIAVTVRGGTTKAPHTHLDLLSFHCVIGKERMLTNASETNYLDTTFSSRRNELFEISSFSKNTILVNGAGIPPDSTLGNTKIIRVKDGEGFRLDATGAFGKMRDGNAVKFCCRAILLMKRKYVLIIDKVELPHVGIVESRMFTPAELKLTRAGAILTGKKEKLRVAYAASTESSLNQSMSTPTMPDVPTCAMLRWITKSQVKEVTMVTLLAPGTGRTGVELDETKKRVEITVTDNKKSFILYLTPGLHPSL